MTAYKSDGTSCTACGVRVGNPAQSNGTFYWRSVGYFDYTPLFGQHISNATFTVSSLAGGTANGYPFGVWLPTAYSYAGAVGGGQEVAGTVDTQGNLTSSALTAQLDYWVHNRIPGGALGFTGYETAGLYTFKQLNNFTLSLTSYSTAPSPPQNPSASATPDGILHASWNPPADDGGAAVTYKINLYHQGGGAPANWLNCSGLGVTWSGLAEDTSWYFGITATNSAGSSAEVYANTVTVDHAPGTPTALLSYPGNGAAYVTWGAPADPGGSPITSYLVAAVDETDQAHPVVWGSAVCCSGYPITGLTNGHAYAIVVYAQDHDGSSPVPAISAANAYVTPSANPPPYPVQQVYYTSAANGGAFLTWRPPLATNGGAAWTSYAVTAWDTYNNTSVYVGQYLNIAATATSFYYPGLTNGHPYVLAISAGNAVGYGTVFANTVTPSSAPPPNPVTNATAQPGDGLAVLQWTQPNNSGVTAATNYIIWRYDDTNPVSPKYLDYQVSGSALPSYTWNGLNNATKYLFYVWADNGNGFAAPMVTNPVTPQNTLGNLLNPTNVQAIPADKAAVVSWTAPTLSFFPVNLLTTYTVYVYKSPPSGGNSGGTVVTPAPPVTSGAGPCSTGSAADPPIVTSPPSPCQVIGNPTVLTNGTSYYFVVTASLLNILQLGVSAASAAITPAGLPFAPINPSATAGNGSATITWQPPAAQPDGTPGNNGSSITSYIITPYLASDNTQAGPGVPASTSPATVAGLTNNTAYYFKVQSVNGVGTGPASTSTNTVTPISPPAAPTDVAAAPGDGTANLTWTLSDPTVAPVASYQIRSVPPISISPVAGAVSGVSVTGLQNGTAYTFTVVAVNSSGSTSSTPSNSVTPQGPVTVGEVTTPLSAGSQHTLSVNADGTVMAYGVNASGQLGDGTTIDNANGTQVHGLTNVVSTAAGGAHSLALTSDGRVFAWGANDSGQLGIGTTVPSTTPVQVTGLSGVSAITAGDNHSVALLSDGSVLTWGNNGSGQLGTGAAELVPTLVPGLPTIVQVSARANYSLALASDGTVWGWGDDSSGQLGGGGSQTSPVQLGGLSGIRTVAAGRTHGLALTTAGGVMAWGDNTSGELGIAMTTTSSGPIAIPGLSGVTGIAAGDAFSLALLADTTAWAWGSNTHFQLGSGGTTTTPNAQPSHMQFDQGPSTSVVLLAAGGEHSALLDASGEIWDVGRHYATLQDCITGMPRTTPQAQTPPEAEPIQLPYIPPTRTRPQQKPFVSEAYDFTYPDGLNTRPEAANQAATVTTSDLIGLPYTDSDAQPSAAGLSFDTYYYFSGHGDTLHDAGPPSLQFWNGSTYSLIAPSAYDCKFSGGLDCYHPVSAPMKRGSLAVLSSCACANGGLQKFSMGNAMRNAGFETVVAFTSVLSGGAPVSGLWSSTFWSSFAGGQTVLGAVEAALAAVQRANNGQGFGYGTFQILGNGNLHYGDYRAG